MKPGFVILTEDQHSLYILNDEITFNNRNQQIMRQSEQTFSSRNHDYLCTDEGYFILMHK